MKRQFNYTQTELLQLVAVYNLDPKSIKLLA